MNPLQNHPTSRDPLDCAIGELNRKLDQESDPEKLAAAYREMTEVLRKVEEACIANCTRLEELRDLRKAAREKYELADNLSKEQIDDEVRRFKYVLDVINELPDKLRNAATSGHDTAQVCVVTLDGAHRGRFMGFYLAPRDRSHIHSPAYMKLWDHLAEQHLEPYFEPRTRYTRNGKCTDLWISVKLPR